MRILEKWGGRVEQSDQPDKDWFRDLRRAHYALLCERNVRWMLRSVPNNFGIVSGNYLQSFREHLFRARGKPNMPLP